MRLRGYHDNHSLLEVVVYSGSFGSVDRSGERWSIPMLSWFAVKAHWTFLSFVAGIAGVFGGTRVCRTTPGGVR